jgi:hypothetical protein
MERALSKRDVSSNLAVLKRCLLKQTQKALALARAGCSSFCARFRCETIRSGQV